MSGIAGIWNLDGQPVNGRLFAKLSATLTHRGLDGEGVWVQGPVALASHLSRIAPESSEERQPFVGASGAVVIFDGRLDNREDLLEALGPSAGVNASAPDSALLVAGYRAIGDRFLERLNGDFALGLYDPGEGRLLLARDALGVRPLYYCRTGGTFLFASEIKALLAHPRVSPRPNDGALAGFLVPGLGLGEPEETFFEGVSRLPPAHLAVVTPRGFVMRRYWDFDPTARTSLGSFPEYAEVFRHHFGRAVRRRLRSAHPVAVSVSGGLDSSSIFCLGEAIRRQSRAHCPPLLGMAYTYPGAPATDERAYLSELGKACGVGIGQIPMPTGPGALDQFAKVVWHGEAPAVDSRWNATAVFLNAVRQRGARVLLTGHWGDQLLGDQAYLVDLVRRLEWRKAYNHLREFARWFTDTSPLYFRRLFYRDLVRHHVPEAIAPCLRWLRARIAQPRPHRRWYTRAFRKRARVAAPDRAPGGVPFNTAHARSLYEVARSKFYVLCMEENNKVAAPHGLEMAYPFLDRDLISFLMAVPGEVLTWEGVPKAILRAALRELPGAIAQRRWKADFSSVVHEGVGKSLSQMARCLHRDSMAVRSGYVSGEAVARLDQSRGRLRGPDCVGSWGLATLFGFEVWLRTFFARQGVESAERGESTCDDRPSPGLSARAT
jgi:asparagine synthase (glutamine-hydrolysing)